MGGLSKKAYQLEKIRRETTLPVLTVDGGRLLFKSPLLAPAEAEEAKATALGIAEAYAIMGYDAVGIGANDLAAGPEFLAETVRRTGLVWLSANLTRRSTGAPLFPGYIVRQAGKLAVGIIGLTAADAASLPADQDVVIKPWREVLLPIVEKLSKECDLLILLTDNTQTENQLIAKEMPAVHLLIQAFPSGANLAPLQAGNTLLCQTAPQGKYLGWLQVDWQQSKSWGDNDTARRLEEKKQELDGVEARLGRFRERLAVERLNADPGYRELLAYRQKLNTEIQELAKNLNRQQTAGSAPATFKNSFIAMETSLPDEPRVRAVVEKTKQAISKIGNRQTVAPLPGPADAFIGWQACVGCHSTQASFWEKTRHATAYRTLETKSQQHNQACLPCHVTAGPGPENPSRPAASLLNLSSTLQVVGCEVCHGPSRAHVADPAAAPLPTRTVASDICQHCHTPDHDDNFDYAVDRGRIACPAGQPAGKSSR